MGQAKRRNKSRQNSGNGFGKNQNNLVVVDVSKFNTFDAVKYVLEKRQCLKESIDTLEKYSRNDLFCLWYCIEGSNRIEGFGVIHHVNGNYADGDVFVTNSNLKEKTDAFHHKHHHLICQQMVNQLMNLLHRSK